MRNENDRMNQNHKGGIWYMTIFSHNRQKSRGVPEFRRSARLALKTANNS